MDSRKKEILKAVAIRLKKVREQLGYSPKEMAFRLKITPGAYNKNEKGTNFPWLDTQRRLLEDFDISMDWFLFNKGTMFFKEKDVREREKELEQAVEELKRQLEEEHKEHEADRKKLEEECKKLEKAVQENEASIEKNPEVRELLDHMERVPMLYHEIMLHFQKFKVEKAELLSPTPAPNAVDLR
ncbi:MAG: helix-turn-helix domain-containing protein [Candidatus Aminicenantes bacterium]|nr:helix-turn-helix domain-containing protein [Candidatus Aminicenantes bacterium]NIM83323.1 helix-turn-helix domain-containing protein [Candidatus Aminicenantes bacterium]NIN22682.1 helix-turn-helix domain-containing protein [Candidatus Aminicenantes bacterium]NIN46442.1 helix-turn-helix domain-containing protein [Candidatus Aminicenantes bacterium]NIN89294.1 helix-turn-helix domain-containing protein [Candidatus Aminicenantes bacterium]